MSICLYRRYTLGPSHTAIFGTPCSSSLSETLWSILSGVDQLARMKSRPFSLASKGAVFFVYFGHALSHSPASEYHKRQHSYFTFLFFHITLLNFTIFVTPKEALSKMHWPYNLPTFLASLSLRSLLNPKLPNWEHSNHVSSCFPQLSALSRPFRYDYMVLLPVSLLHQQICQPCGSTNACSMFPRSALPVILSQEGSLVFISNNSSSLIGTLSFGNEQPILPTSASLFFHLVLEC